MLWTDGSVPFLFGKGDSGVLANCCRCGTEAPSFQHAHYAQVLSLKPAPFCKLFAGLGCTNKSATCLGLSLCPLLHPFFYLNLSGRNCFLFLPVLSGYNGCPDTRFSRGTTRLMMWPDGKCSWCPLPFLVVILLSFLVSTLFSGSGSVLSHQNFLTRRFPRFPPRNLCSLDTLAVFSLVFVATDTAKELNSYLIRIGRIENPSCSACGHSTQDTSHLILYCPATDFLRRSLFGDSLSLYDLWSRPWGVAWLLGLHGLSPCLHPSEGVG